MSWPPNYSYGQPVLLVQAPPQDQPYMRIPKNGDGMSLRKIKKTINFLKELEEAKKKGGDKKDEKKDSEKKMNPVQMFALLVFVGPWVAAGWLAGTVFMAHLLAENLHTMFK